MGVDKRGRLPLDLAGLGARDDLFLLSGALKADPAVEIWLAGDPVELRMIARTWFLHMRGCAADVTELMHDGCPVACVQDAPFCYVNTFSRHVNVGFFRGAVLKDPMYLLEGKGKRMRHVKLTPGGKIDSAALGDLIDAAYRDIRARLNKE